MEHFDNPPVCAPERASPRMGPRRALDIERMYSTIQKYRLRRRGDNVLLCSADIYLYNEHAQVYSAELYMYSTAILWGGVRRDLNYHYFSYLMAYV